MTEPCNSTYKVGAGTILHCHQHLGTSRNWKHSSRHLGIRWYWTTAEADQQNEAMTGFEERA